MSRRPFVRPLLFMALASLTAVAVAACSSNDPTPTPTTSAGNTPTAPANDEPQYGGTLSYWIRSDPPGWDMWGTTRFFDPTRKIGELVFNPLFSPAAQVGESCAIEIEPEIAESWEYVEPTVLEFKIREGVHWQNKPPLNGREVTADDIVYNLNVKFAQGLAGAAYVGQVFFESAEKVDDHTVRVNLTQPFDFIAGMPSGHRQGWIVAPEVSGEDMVENPEESWIGTGPFMFVEHQTGTKVVFERNPDYFKEGLPYADKVEVHVIPDASTRLAALRSGQINVFPAAAPRTMEEIRDTNPDYFIKSCPGDFQLEILMRLDKEPWNDVRVRRAVSMAIDRDAIVNTALRGDGLVVAQAWPLDPEALEMDDYPEDVQQYMEYNPDKAKQLLTEAGFPNGFSTTVVWTAAYGQPWSDVAELMLTMLRAVGIDAEFTMMEYGPFLGARNAQTYEDLYFGWGNVFDINDIASTSFWSEIQPPNPLTLNPDPELNDMVERLWAADAATRPEVLEELQVYVADHAYRVTSPVWGNGIIARPEVKNVGWRGTNKMYHQIFERAWIAQ